MKYILALDKGNYYKRNERYIKLNLGSINEKLEADNNLEALWKFTSYFDTRQSLVDFLISKNIVNQKNRKYDLVIIYQLNYIRNISIPYACDAKYFDPLELEKVIYKNARQKNFLEQLIHEYKDNKLVMKEIYSFRVYLSNPYADYKFYDVVRQFVDKLCFQTKNGQRTKRVKSLFDLAMFLAMLTNPNRNAIINRKIDLSFDNISSCDNKDDELTAQIKLF